MNHQYIIYTTVDITYTGITSNSKKTSASDLMRNQQRNFDTLCQVISLRANIYNPVVYIQSMNAITDIFPNPNLPDEYLCWTMEFYCDHSGVFGENNQELHYDLHMTPIIPALTETVPQFPPYFISYGELRNIFIP